ncbi:MAG: CPBP family intramembrane metalloprotease [Aquabacterium sp.]|uniref:CPBP family intramembrane glutamic endopeptidase n=1 Tax=Aquabacterium sp. TaxID=1872578 RepID=UPI0025BD61F0|nr:CPBP family intramembrane glutamic endopeptidase [Aquabacterium sp.]MBI3383596.1 CPBP family intramembrane metalloprotease [Aquabacterium sp.]
MTMAGVSVGLLGLAIVASWWPSRAPGGAASAWVPPWCLLLVAAVLAGLIGGVLSWPALLPLAGFMCLGWLTQEWARSRWPVVVFGAMALALALHAFPWFQRVPVFEAVQLSAGAPSFALFASVDKALAGLGLLVWVCRRCSSLSEVITMLRATVPVLLLTVVAVLGLGVMSHAVHWDPKWPAQAPAFLAVNLLFTCVAEEAFFRGLLQARLTQALGASPLACWLPALVSAGLFGAVHLGGGWPLAVLAGVAGLGYAVAYARTRRIESAILTHVAVNATHFLLFTYPALA